MIWRAYGMDVAPQAVLHWDHGALEAECDRAAVVRAGVEAYLGRSVFAADGEALIRVTLSRVVERGSKHVVAKVEQEDADGQKWGERTVSGDESCASLDEQLTLVVALMVDHPSGGSEPTGPEPPQEEPAPRSPLARQPPVEPVENDSEATGEILTAPSLERASVAPAHAAFLGVGLVSMGALPGTGVGAGLVARFKPKGFLGLGLEVGALAPQRKSIASGWLEVSQLTLSASLCPLQGFDGDVWWSACASFGAARLSVQSQDLLDSKALSEWIGLPSVDARAAWVVRRKWLLGAGLEAGFPLSPDRYVYRDSQGAKQTAFEGGALTLTANLGVGVLID